MIGVISKQKEHEVIEEFFQLFKTPWELYNPDRLHYEVLVATDGNLPETDASLIVIYGIEKSRLDVYELAEAELQETDAFVERDDIRLPIYGKAVTFLNPDRPILFFGESRAPIGYETRKGEQRILRIGYGLFQEVLFLLTKGQPPENALIPTLDLHIEMLRNWIVETGIPLVEIPPVPVGYRFITCLTHDVDFIGIQWHFFDHSMWGFVYRASIDSLLSVFKGKTPVSKLLENLKAVCCLPLVFLGVCRDPWDQFDCCLEIERDARSTFFFIPFKNRVGQAFAKGKAKRRATKYDIEDVEAVIQKLFAHGCEIGVHGIDAWNSIEKGRQELQRIQRKIAVQNGIGIRMHWLWRNEHTFEILDKAGYSYDSTLGYNETVGFRAGTAQVFKPIGVNNLLEIPLHIQDKALFGHGGINASEKNAEELFQEIMNHIILRGGTLTVLWHQRSLGPERLWGDYYERLVGKLQEQNTWFATASEVAEWFRMRRSTRFEPDNLADGTVKVFLDQTGKKALPPLFIRSYPEKKSLSFVTFPVDPSQKDHEMP